LIERIDRLIHADDELAAQWNIEFHPDLRLEYRLRGVFGSPGGAGRMSCAVTTGGAIAVELTAQE
jgi:hypothetical protein